MNDAAPVRGVKAQLRSGLPIAWQSLPEVDPAHALRQRLAVDVLHDEVGDAILSPHVVDRTNVRMVQAGDHLRFTLEPHASDGIVGNACR